MNKKYSIFVTDYWCHEFANFGQMMKRESSANLEQTRCCNLQYRIVQHLCHFFEQKREGAQNWRKSEDLPIKN